MQCIEILTCSTSHQLCLISINSKQLRPATVLLSCAPFCEPLLSPCAPMPKSSAPRPLNPAPRVGTFMPMPLQLRAHVSPGPRPRPNIPASSLHPYPLAATSPRHLVSTTVPASSCARSSLRLRPRLQVRLFPRHPRVASPTCPSALVSPHHCPRLPAPSPCPLLCVHVPVPVSRARTAFRRSHCPPAATHTCSQR